MEGKYIPVMNTCSLCVLIGAQGGRETSARMGGGMSLIFVTRTGSSNRF